MVFCPREHYFNHHTIRTSAFVFNPWPNKKKESTLAAMSGMSTFQKILAADAAGPAAQRMYETSGKALAGLVPLAVLSPTDSTVATITDLALIPVITLHSHISLNCVISDYVPPAVRGLARYGLLGVSAGAALGLTKLAFTSPGISGSVKKLWE